MRFGELAVILCSFVFAGVHVTVLGLLRDNFQCPLGQWFFHCNLCVCVCNDMLVVLKCVVFRAFCSVLLSFSVFSPPSIPLIIIVSIIIFLFSPLNSQFSVMGALAEAWCCWRGSWLGCR